MNIGLPVLRSRWRSAQGIGSLAGTARTETPVTGYRSAETAPMPAKQVFDLKPGR